MAVDGIHLIMGEVPSWSGVVPMLEHDVIDHELLPGIRNRIHTRKFEQVIQFDDALEFWDPVQDPQIQPVAVIPHELKALSPTGDPSDCGPDFFETVVGLFDFLFGCHFDVIGSLRKARKGELIYAVADLDNDIGLKLLDQVVDPAQSFSVVPGTVEIT